MENEGLVERRVAIAALEAETLAARARMEGMKAANRQHKLSGGKRLPYTEQDFFAVESVICAAMQRFSVDAEMAKGEP